jgi:hypothetical protein
MATTTAKPAYDAALLEDLAKVFAEVALDRLLATVAADSKIDDSNHKEKDDHGQREHPRQR